MNDKICVNGKASELIIEIVDNILKEKINNLYSF